MRLLYLYIENFQCYEKSEIDFSAFNSAIIIGRMDNNDLIANGVGKTSIFKAIEYVIFNQVRDPILLKDMILEKLIRDDASKVLVILDFEIDGEIYRISRSRTRKGVSDLSLYKANGKILHTPETDKKVWENISGRRTADTELDLAKLIKISYKSFMNTAYFIQNDMSGLATATPEKRRLILKETLGLLIYASLEKMAKKRAEDIFKQIEKNRIIQNTIGDPQKSIDDFNKEISLVEEKIINKGQDISKISLILEKLRNEDKDLSSRLSIVKAQSSATIAKRDNFARDIAKIQASIAEYSNKKKQISKEAKIISEELTKLKNDKKELDVIDFSEITALQEKITKLLEEIRNIDIKLAVNKSELEELKVPLPADGTCKHCRQLLTDAHRRACEQDILKQIKEKENVAASLFEIKKSKQYEYTNFQNSYKELEKKKNNLATTNSKLDAKNKEIIEKKKVYEDFVALINQFEIDLAQKQKEHNEAQLEVNASSEQEIKELEQKITENRKDQKQQSEICSFLEKELSELTNKKAILGHSIQEKEKDLLRQKDLKKELAEQEEKYALHPLVIQAFDSIPDIIIANILDDLQEEANKLLEQIRPGLQLSFTTEKTRSDGEQDDTLQINYFLNNKPRDYSQLSGAQRVYIFFALKLGLLFLLSKMFNFQIKFLLFDELDQSLDKASLDAFADIIHFFQNDFTILVISHNDRLQQRFNSAILVEQNQNMVSRASVVSSW
jgi:DNA repair protein SbcC/Rad50